MSIKYLTNVYNINCKTYMFKCGTVPTIAQVDILTTHFVILRNFISLTNICNVNLSF